jgi:hypothetical protein
MQDEPQFLSLSNYLMMRAALDKMDLNKQGLVVQFLHLRSNQHHKYALNAPSAQELPTNRYKEHICKLEDSWAVCVLCETESFMFSV